MQTDSGYFFELEAQLQPELQITCVESSTSLSKGCIPNAVVVLTFGTRQFKVRVIQDIEAFGTKLELGSLRNMEVLEE
jgi:hypothetical protein